MNKTKVMKATAPKQPASTVELRVRGKLAQAVLTRTPNGDRIARLTFENGKKLTFTADRINLRDMESEDIKAALNKACHVTGRISLYNLTTHNGPKATTRVYSSESNGQETGYGLLLKKGKKALSFALSRVDTAAMKAKSLQDAARKATYTGRIALASA